MTSELTDDVRVTRDAAGNVLQLERVQHPVAVAPGRAGVGEDAAAAADGRLELGGDKAVLGTTVVSHQQVHQGLPVWPLPGWTRHSGRARTG